MTAPVWTTALRDADEARRLATLLLDAAFSTPATPAECNRQDLMRAARLLRRLSADGAA